MNLKKMAICGLMATALTAYTGFSPSYVSAEETDEQPAAEAQAAVPADEAAAVAPQQNKIHLGYKYTSQRYGYSIYCPTKPDVMPASMLDDGEKGDVLIFRSQGTHLTKAWIIRINAYTDEMIPPNLNAMNEAEKKTLIQKFSDNYGFEFARVAEIGDQCTGVLGITAKDVEIDTNGDGIPDTKAHSDTQMVKIFMPGQYGGHFALELISNPEITQENLDEFEAAATTFQQWPDSGYEQAKKNALNAKTKRK